MPLDLDSKVGAIPECKPAEAARLGALGVLTVRDLLLYLPFGWEDFGGPKQIEELVPGELATVVGTLQGIHSKQTARRRMKLAEGKLRDRAGATLDLVWFNQPWRTRDLHAGQRLVVAGPVTASRWGLQMRNPEVQTTEGPVVRLGGLTPKYHLTKGLKSKTIAKLVASAIHLADQLEDTLPPELFARNALMPLPEAVRTGHQPPDLKEWRGARHRMDFAEVFELQTAFMLVRQQLAVEPAGRIPYRQGVIDRFKAGLPFELTRAQKRATWDVFQEMDAEHPMNRLLNGDVGSGKTAVAAAAAAMVHAAGKQTVVMAPTEILARQHLHKFRAYLEDSFEDLKVELLVSGLPAAERRRVRMSAASGHCALLVGTHALIEEEVELADLGLAVVDEQHRFGTRQREALRRKGTPHFLAMTATPIPRTLALAVYGEMALSVIDEMPPGRTPVDTGVVVPAQRERAYDLVRREVRAGRQAFVICPLIEESESLETKAATVEFERLRTEVFPDLRLRLVHGRMKDKDDTMRAFAAGEADVLVATPVVEVGVDIPNATVMLIEGADRFGLAQLHQFRGRVGRGAAQSYCLLFADEPGEETLKRLELVTTVHDGFRLAEEDLKLRGSGQLIGARQHGVADAAMRALEQPKLLDEAREAAQRVLADDPGLERHPVLKAAVDRRLELTSIS